MNTVKRILYQVIVIILKLNNRTALSIFVINSPMKTLLISTLLFVAAFLLPSCTDKPEPEDEVFQLGDFESYQIESSPGFSVTDPVSGCIFSFPSGGTGKLSVSSIIEGPDLNEIDAGRFMLEYDGTGEVELLVPINNMYVQAFVYGPIEGASVKPNIGEHSWSVMIEQDTIVGNLRFDIELGDPEKEMKTGSKKYKAPKSKYFAVSKITKDSDNWNKLVAFYHTIKEVSDLWISSMPSSEYERLKELMSGNMEFDVRLSSSNYYQHFNNWVWGKNAIFYLKPSTPLSGLAHETGHYMNHLICGYEKYIEIYGAMPKKYWGLGGTIDHLFGMFIEGRSYLLEEYAHFSEFLATGSVEDHDMFNVQDINYFSQAVSADPAKKDYPSHEGFGTAMLAALMRTESSIHIFDIDNKTKVKVPVIAAGKGDIIHHILAKGPKNVNELHSAIRAYLLGKGQSELKKLPAILEPLGWSYFGKGKLVNEDGDPLSGAKIMPLVIAGEEYAGPLSEASNNKGEFTLKRMAPGNSHIRVYYNFTDNEFKDSADLEISIDPLLKTNEEVDLGEKVVEFQDKMETKVYTKVAKTRIYQPSASLAGQIITSQMDFNAEITQSVRNSTLQSESFLENTEVSSLISLRVDCKTNSLVTASFFLKWSLSNYSWTWEYLDQTNYISQAYELTGKPEITEENYGEGSYAPTFTWTQDREGMVEASLLFYPDSLFKDQSSRRFRLNAKFKGTRETTTSGGNKYTYNESFSPSSVVISFSKKY